MPGAEWFPGARLNYAEGGETVFSLLGRGLDVAFIGVILGGLALVAWLLLRLERIISPEVNGVAPTGQPRASVEATTS